MELFLRLAVCAAFLPLMPTASFAQDNDLAAALAVCQKDPEPEARIACYNAVKEIQTVRDTPLLNALVNNAEKKSATENSDDQKENKPDPKEEFAKSAVEAKILGKKFYKSDYTAGRYEDFLNVQIAFKAAGIEKPTRAIKGVLVFTDLFDEPMVRMQWTLDDPMTPDQEVKYMDSGFSPNQFKDSHSWLKNTEVDDIKVRYEIESIIYADGSKWSRK